ncbi:hypothetical protein BKA64DRAFT_767373, partial [Cadophora sp. MPI-SDFR-AT-0126]
DYDETFSPLLKRTVAVLEKQIEGALHVDIEIKTGESSGLSYKSSSLTKLYSVTAIATGATLRALCLKDGLERKAVSGYGFLRTEPFEPNDPDQEEGHKEAQIKADPFDGHEYVTVIDCFMHKNDLIEAIHEYHPFVCTHAFGLDKRKFECEEILYVNESDNIQSHYDVKHSLNKDAQIVGRIITDMTFLRDQGLISPVGPKPDENGVLRGKPHYEVTYDLVPIVEGRDLKYVARFPAGEGGAVMKEAQICIAAAFKPGIG